MRLKYKDTNNESLDHTVYGTFVRPYDARNTVPPPPGWRQVAGCVCPRRSLCACLPPDEQVCVGCHDELVNP